MASSCDTDSDSFSRCRHCRAVWPWRNHEHGAYRRKFEVPVRDRLAVVVQVRSFGGRFFAGARIPHLWRKTATQADKGVAGISAGIGEAIAFVAVFMLM